MSDEILDATELHDRHTDEDLIEPHEAGCTFGGFSCQYWLVAEGCERRHPNVHVHGRDEFCPLTL